MRGTTPILTCDGEDGSCGTWVADHYETGASSVAGVRVTREQRAPGWLNRDDEDLCPAHRPAVVAEPETPVEPDVADCTNYLEVEDRQCTGTLSFGAGDQQAACNSCGAWCGRLVANYRQPVAVANDVATSAPVPPRVVHLMPAPAPGTMPCCGIASVLLPAADTATYHKDKVTCPGAPTAGCGTEPDDWAARYARTWLSPTAGDGGQ